MEDNTHVDWIHTKRVSKDFEIKTLKEYHDLNIQSDTFSLPDVFENFRNTFLEKYELEYARFYCTRISMASCFKIDQGQIRSIN